MAPQVFCSWYMSALVEYELKFAGYPLSEVSHKVLAAHRIESRSRHGSAYGLAATRGIPLDCSPAHSPESILAPIAMASRPSRPIPS